MLNSELEIDVDLVEEFFKEFITECGTDSEKWEEKFNKLPKEMREMVIDVKEGDTKLNITFNVLVNNVKVTEV